MQVGEQLFQKPVQIHQKKKKKEPKKPLLISGYIQFQAKFSF